MFFLRKINSNVAVSFYRDKSDNGNEEQRKILNLLVYRYNVAIILKYVLCARCDGAEVGMALWSALTSETESGFAFTCSKGKDLNSKLTLITVTTIIYLSNAVK